MKKLILALTLAFLFVSGSAFAATFNCVMNTLAANIGPHVTSEFLFTIETDGAGNITAFTDFMSNHLYTTLAGGSDPRDGGPFAAGEQIYPNSVKQYTSTAFDGNTTSAGTTMWWRGLANSDGPFAGLMFNWGLLQFDYDTTTLTGFFVIAPKLSLSETYTFSAWPVPIPGAVFLLGSGLFGIIGFRRKFRKS